MIIRSGTQSSVARVLGSSAQLEGNESTVKLPNLIMPVVNIVAPLVTQNFGSSADARRGNSWSYCSRITGAVGPTDGIIMVLREGLWNVRIRAQWRGSNPSGDVSRYLGARLDPLTSGQTQEIFRTAFNVLSVPESFSIDLDLNLSQIYNLEYTSTGFFAGDTMQCDYFVYATGTF